jgi:hypothetical protein
MMGLGGEMGEGKHVEEFQLFMVGWWSISQQRPPETEEEGWGSVES